MNQYRRQKDKKKIEILYKKIYFLFNSLRLNAEINTLLCLFVLYLTSAPLTGR